MGAMKPDPMPWGRALSFVRCWEADLKTTRRNAQHRWTRKVTVTPRVMKRLPTSPRPKILEPSRESGDAVHLGPYESAYDVALGYGFERAIETP